MSPTPLHAKQEHHHHRLPPSPSTGPPPPVIIYTYSPKVIHTHPRDFMALVQKLTGYSPPLEAAQPTRDQRQRQDEGDVEDNESSFVVTEEHGGSVNDVVSRVNSCFVIGGAGIVPPGPPPYKVAGFDRCFNPTPVFPANPTNFLCKPTQQLPFYTPDFLLLNRNSLSSSLRVLQDYPDI
ncbi:hypothetical protein L1987_32739 [Smallanthus sonchifolius]|uniref:Uncharacterized protein n=1 Tax=Smallanthus sonchifolius TaxID=185202 RepID=A0ACB9HNV3_9ASTR|nr:hypothetical protein L1987_32739 [Smallanthus sonchifolius]